MGLLIKLQNGDTQLKSLKFGSDRLGGGDSGQPYIQTSVDTEPGQDAGTDFLLRGGINAPADALTDVKRLTKYMFDLKSPSGGLFVVKQNLLSRVSPKTEASKGLGYAFGALNNGVYSPLSTLTQAGVGFLGGHVNKQGLDPTGLFPGLSINKYEKIAYDNNKDSLNKLYPSFPIGLVELANNIASNPLINGLTPFSQNELPLSGKKTTEDVGSFENRLLKIWFEKQYKTTETNDVLSYGGGPGSVLGVGKTHIEFAKDGDGASLRTGKNNPLFYTKAFQYGGKPIVTTEIDSAPYYSPIEDIITNTYQRQLTSAIQFDKDGITNSNAGGSARTWGVTSNGNLLGTYSSRNTLKRDFTDAQLSGSYGNALWDNFNRYYGFQLGNVKHALKDGGYLADLDKNAGTWKEDGKTIGNHNNAYPGGIAPDFRLVPRKIRGLYPFLDSQKPTSFRKDNGKISQLDWDETSTTWIDEGGNLKSNTLDKIYYNSNQSSFRTSNPLDTENDLISFRISIIDPTVPNKDPFQLNFRAYIDSLSDSYAADWKSQTYMGRGEKFYKYNSFERDISLAFTVVADNKANLNIMYDQLNRLAASLAPTYTGQGYMAGNLHKLTIGNYVYDQPGILTSLTYDITEESPWEIDKDNQLPFYIKVTGMKFIPIHTFRPEATFKPAKSDKNSVHNYINQPSS